MTSNAPVTQEDREAAAEIAETLLINSDLFPALIRNGEHDNHPFVQSYARHRQGRSNAGGVNAFEAERLRAALEDTMTTLSAVKAEAIVDGGGACLWIAEKLNQQMIDNRAALQHKGEVSRG